MAKKAKGIAPSYFQQLLPEEKKRYQEKIRIISGIDPFTLSLASARHGQSVTIRAARTMPASSY